MPYSESWCSKFLLCVGLFLVTSTFCHCTRLTKLKALDKLRRNWMLTHGQAKRGELRHGILLIGHLQDAELDGPKGTKNFLDVDTDYQADMDWGQFKQAQGQGDASLKLKPDGAALERLLKMEPKVECTGDSMKLEVHDAPSTPGSLFFVDRGIRLSPLPLSKLPPSCGYSIRSTRKDLVLVAPYDGCFVALEEDSYVLPLRWFGLPVRMSCPLMRQSSPNPPMVTCHAGGMVVKTEWTISVAKIRVNLNGKWQPLMEASPRCGFSVVVHPEGVVIAVHYSPCLEKKDGMYTLELAGDGETKISCPSLSAKPEPTKGKTDSPSKGFSAFTHAPERTPKNPAESAVPQFPDTPQYPGVPGEKPNQGPKDIYQPRQPYFPVYPNFFYPNPANPGTRPTLTPTSQQSQQTAPPAELLNPEGQVPQSLLPLPFYPWPDQPEEGLVENGAPGQPQTTQLHNNQEKRPFYPYPFPGKPLNPDGVPSAPRPELKPLPSTAPTLVKPTKDPRQQLFYSLPIYPQPPSSEVPPTEPPMSKPPLNKLEEYLPPNSFNYPSLPSEEPAEPSGGQEHKPLYPFPFYTWPSQPAPLEPPKVDIPHPLYPENPTKFVPQQPVPLKPDSEEPQEQIYKPFYPYPFLPQGPYPPVVPPTHQSPLAPQGQEQQPVNPLQQQISQPDAPENWVPGKPSPAPASKVPAQPETARGQVYQPFYPNPFHHWSEPEKPTTVPKPPQPDAPPSQVHLPFYPNHYFSEPENQPATKPTAVPKPPEPSQPEAPQSQVYLPFYPNHYFSESGHQPATKPPEPPQPEVPQSQVYQPIHPYHFYMQRGSENEPTGKPSAASQPQQPEAPQGQVQQPHYPMSQPQVEKPIAVPKPMPGPIYNPFYPYPFYLQPGPENELAVPKPRPTEMPKGQVNKPHPQEVMIPGAVANDKDPTEKPVERKPLPGGQVPQPFNPYFYYPHQPQHPQLVTLSPSPTMQQPQQVITPAASQKTPETANSQPSNGGSSYRPPVYCPQFCPSGFSNCCPQIAFHQHLHHIVPSVPGNKETLPIYPGLPFLSSAAYSGFGSSFGSALLPQTTISPRSPPSGKENLQHVQPPEGNHAALPGSNPSRSTHAEQQINPHFRPYSNWPHQVQNEELQTLPQWRSPVHYSMPSKVQAPGSEPVNPMVQYVPYNVQLPNLARVMNNLSGPIYMPFNPQQLHTLKQQNKLAAKELHTKSGDSRGMTPSKVRAEPDSLPLPYYMLQDAQAPTYYKSVSNNSTRPQPFVSGSKKSNGRDQAVNAHSQAKGYVLLQHGTLDREPNGLNESLLHFLMQNQASHQSNKAQHPQNLKPQHPKWLEKGMSNPLPGNVNNMPKPGDQSESSPHFVPLAQDPSLSGAHFNPKFFASSSNFWKTMTPLDSHVSGNINGGSASDKEMD